MMYIMIYLYEVRILWIILLIIFFIFYENQFNSTTNTHQSFTYNNPVKVNLNYRVYNITDVLNKLENITYKTNPGPDMIQTFKAVSL